MKKYEDILVNGRKALCKSILITCYFLCKNEGEIKYTFFFPFEQKETQAELVSN